MATKHPLIESDPAVMGGKPVVAGTRITVELILDKLAAGETVEQILDFPPALDAREHPGRTRFCRRGASRGRCLSREVSG